MMLALVTLGLIARGSFALQQVEPSAEPKACWNLLPDGLPTSDQCNCTACMERGSAWRYFTNPHLSQITGGLTFLPPMRYCLQLNSSGHPIRPPEMRDYEWKPFANATSMINMTGQCPEVLCPKLSNCGDCARGISPSSPSSAPVPCTWRGPAPALANRSKGLCVFVGDTRNFSSMVKWNDFPSFEDTQSRRKCSLRGLIPRNRTHNLCSSINKGAQDSAASCANESKVQSHPNAVCLRGGGNTEFDCRSECDLYGGACRGVTVLEGLFRGSPCFACLLFEECFDPLPGEDFEVVSFGPPVLGDWINSPNKCPGSCEGYRFPGLEVPPMDVNSATYYRPWYSYPNQCFQDTKCKFCSLPFPTQASNPFPHRADDIGCYDKNDVPEDVGGVKPYCAWDKYLGHTPETACAQHTTYAACAGSYSIGCQWCLSRKPAARFRQVANASNPALVDELKPQCVYYLDAMHGCLSMSATHKMPVESQVPLLQLFEKGKLDTPREQSCGAHQLFSNRLTMVSDNSSEPDAWYHYGTFDVSSALDLSYIPMYVPKAERERQLEMLKRCTGDEDTTLRVATKECQQVFANTCSRCLRTPGCWWRDNGLKSRVAGEWDIDLGADSFLPGCFPSSAQQTYVSTATALSTRPDYPLRALTVPEDSQFCFDPCWKYNSCGGCLSNASDSGHKCQWCDYPDNGDGVPGSVCTSVSGPYHICQDKYTDLKACPSNRTSSLAASKTQPIPFKATGAATPSNSDSWYPTCIAAISVLVFLPLLIVVACIRMKNLRHRRRNASAQAELLADVGDDCQGDMQTGSVRDSGDRSEHCCVGTGPTHHSRVQIDFANLGFRAKVGQEEKQILRAVSGSISSGEFLAVMGPSGSGKTTFLDVLAKRKLNLKDCDGEVCVNGNSVELHVRSYTGWLTEFVPQHDTLLPVHTVTEMLRFVADLKLPASTPSSQKDERVREVIKMVGLEHRAQAYIGSNLVRGLSGGERRRAMIASALVSRAPVLFLDEPTSGLSSTDSLRVVEMLGTLAKTHGYAVIAVVHQPQSRLFNHFDKLLLLSEGEVCYMGNAHESVAWFERVTAAKMPSAMNPADWLLDVITPGLMQVNAIESCKKQASTTREEGSSQIPNVSHDESTPQLVVDLSTTREFATSRWKQFRVIIHRCFQAKIRSWGVLLTRFGVNLFVAAIAGSALPIDRPMYVHAITGEPSRTLNAVLFFVVTFQGLIALTVLPLFSEERELFAHERKAKFYRVLPYFIANCLAECVVQAYSSLLFGMVFYVIVSPSREWSRFLFYLLTTVLVGDCASAFAQCCSSVSRSIVNSLALCAMGLGCFLLFSGFLMLPSSMPMFWTPTYHCSFLKYGFQALTINEYENAHFPCQSLNYSLATQCPPFNVSNACPTFPCMNKSSGHAAAVHEFRRFNDIAEVHNAFLTSGVAGMFLGSADARQVNCRLLCGPEEAPGRYDGDDCVCSSFSGCRNDTSDCDPLYWKENKGMCPNTRHLNGLPANGSCGSEVQHVAGEYFLDGLGFGRLDANGKPSPENDPNLAGATTSYVFGSPHITKYVWLGALVAIMTTFRVANFILILKKVD